MFSVLGTCPHILLSLNRMVSFPELAELHWEGRGKKRKKKRKKEIVEEWGQFVRVSL